MVKFIEAALVVVLSLVTQTSCGELVLLDFSSPTCGPCEQMKPTIERLRSAGYPIRPVDTTTEPQLAAQYNVTQVPCFILVADGRELERIVGGTTSEVLQAMFRRAAALPQQQTAAGVRTQSPDAQQPLARPAASPWMGVVQQNRGQSVSPVQPASLNQTPDSRLSTANPPLSTSGPQSADLISASVRIRVDDATGRSFGTGTIVDARSGEALVVTCGHLFRESRGQGPIVVELFESTPSGPRVVGQVAGQVINYNLDRDVALVAIRPGRPVGVAPIAPSQAAIQRGDRVTSVGCDNGQDPTALPTRVTALDRYQGPPNIEAAGAPVEGRSGGGLFNGQGQLVGVCFAADYEGNEGLYTALQAIHDELDAAGLSDIYRPSDAGNVSAGLAAAGPGGLSPVVRGQDALPPATPPAMQAIPATQTGVPPAPMSAAAIAPSGTRQPAPPGGGLAGSVDNSLSVTPTGLSAVEQAAWEEIASRAATSEVICIIRPKEPGGQSEVITLDNVSRSFVEALARQQRPGQAAPR
jgi:thiol-disulfide isomerase/thioredoxin